MIPLSNPAAGWGPMARVFRVLVRHGFGSMVDQLERRVHLKPMDGTSPNATHLRQALEELGPVAVKLGQQLSTRTDLIPADWASELAKLQDAVTPAPWNAVREVLESELSGPVSDVFAQFEPTPIASASLGQVHLARLQNGQEVVVKVQRPEIAGRVENDLEVLARLAHLADRNLELGRIYDFPAMVEEFADAVRDELDYRKEGRNADRFQKLFANEPRLRVPKIHWEHTSRRVLVMERLSGIKIDDLTALDQAGVDRHRLALEATRMVVREVLETGFFHADMHPGNLFVLENGVIGVMDFGRVGKLEPETRSHLARLYVAVVDGDPETIAEELDRLGAISGEIDRPHLERDLRRLVERYRGTRLTDVRVSEVWGDILRLAGRHRLHLPSNLVLLAQTLTMVEGLGLMVDPHYDTFAISRPIVEDIRSKLWSFETWWPEIRRALRDITELVSRSPRSLRRAFEQLERGKFTMRIDSPDLERFGARMDRLANRLVVGLILAAFVVALGNVIPSLERAQPGGGLSQLATVGFLAAGLLGVYLIWRVWRSDR